MKKAWLNFIRSFQPHYKVNAITYFVVPGVPVNRNENVVEFGKGEKAEAKAFFDKVVKRTQDLRFGPVEIHLIKGNKSVIEKKTFGPVDSLHDNKQIKANLSDLKSAKAEKEKIPSVELEGHVSPVHMFGISRMLRFSQTGE